MSVRYCPGCMRPQPKLSTCLFCHFQQSAYVAPPTALPIDDVVGDYRLGAMLASNRQSQCYVALSEKTGQTVLLEEFFPFTVAGRSTGSPYVADCGKGGLYATAVKLFHDSRSERSLTLLESFFCNNTAYRVYELSSLTAPKAQAEKLMDEPIFFRDEHDKPIMSINALAIPPLPRERVYAYKSKKRPNALVWVVVALAVALAGLCCAIVFYGDTLLSVVPRPTVSVEATATIAPTAEPTAEPTEEPTAEPTEEPTEAPTEVPTASPEPTAEPTEAPMEEPKAPPTEEPTEVPGLIAQPTAEPTEAPTASPEPTAEPTEAPTEEPTEVPGLIAQLTAEPTEAPMDEPKAPPELTAQPTQTPAVKLPVIPTGISALITKPDRQTQDLSKSVDLPQTDDAPDAEATATPSGTDDGTSPQPTAAATDEASAAAAPQQPAEGDADAVDGIDKPDDNQPEPTDDETAAPDIDMLIVRGDDDKGKEYVRPVKNALNVLYFRAGNTADGPMEDSDWQKLNDFIASQGEALGQPMDVLGEKGYRALLTQAYMQLQADLYEVGTLTDSDSISRELDEDYRPDSTTRSAWARYNNSRLVLLTDSASDSSFDELRENAIKSRGIRAQNCLSILFDDYKPAYRVVKGAYELGERELALIKEALRHEVMPPYLQPADRDELMTLAAERLCEQLGISPAPDMPVNGEGIFADEINDALIAFCDSTGELTWALDIAATGIMNENFDFASVAAHAADKQEDEPEDEGEPEDAPVTEQPEQTEVSEEPPQATDSKSFIVHEPWYTYVRLVFEDGDKVYWEGEQKHDAVVVGEGDMFAYHGEPDPAKSRFSIFRIGDDGSVLTANQNKVAGYWVCLSEEALEAQNNSKDIVKLTKRLMELKEVPPSPDGYEFTVYVNKADDISADIPMSQFLPAVDEGWVTTFDYDAR